MMSIAVCDDEILECLTFSEKIEKVLNELKVPHIIRQFKRRAELLRTMESFDLVFLDILMPDLDGMEMARLFREKPYENMLVFFSTSRKYVFDAYNVEAFWYLLKPLDMGKLKTVLTRAVQKTEKNSMNFIMVSKERQKIKLFLDDICYFEIMVHGPEGNFTYYGRIGVWEESLLEKGFLSLGWTGSMCSSRNVHSIKPRLPFMTCFSRT